MSAPYIHNLETMVDISFIFIGGTNLLPFSLKQDTIISYKSARRLQKRALQVPNSPLRSALWRMKEPLRWREMPN